MVVEEVLVVAVGVVLLAAPIMMYEAGAPFGACSTMTPGHGYQPIAASPYTIRVSATRYKPDNTITVTVEGPEFQGIMMQVRKVGTNKVHGSWSNLAADTRTQTCTNEADTVTHVNINTKQDAQFTWTPPEDVTDDLHVVATVAQEKARWWRGLTSATLTFDIPTTTTSTTTTTTTTTPAPTDVMTSAAITSVIVTETLVLNNSSPTSSKGGPYVISASTGVGMTTLIMITLTLTTLYIIGQTVS